MIHIRRPGMRAIDSARLPSWLRFTSRARVDELNAMPYGSSAIRAASGSRRPMPRAAATNCAVRLGVPSRIAASELVRHAVRAIADLVVLALDGAPAAVLVDERHVVPDLFVLELVDARPIVSRPFLMNTFL